MRFAYAAHFPRRRPKDLRVASLSLRDFRSYAALDLAFSPGLVLIVGPNGAGKTNLLEALHVATQGFSPRTRADANLIRFGRPEARVAAQGEADRGGVTIEVRLEPGAKTARLNGSALPALDRLRTELAVLAFTPDRLALVKAGPSVRRIYLDRVLSRLFPARANLPGDYAGVLAQRNTALRRVGVGLSSPEAVLPWSERLVAVGSELVSARRLAIDALGSGFEERSGELGLDGARIDYVPSPLSVEALERQLARDLERGTTSAGPHLDEIRVLAGTRELRTHGSQGEQRVAVLALLLAEGDLLRESRRVPPLLLLDDVLSELDGTRREALAARVSVAGQVVVTAAARGALPGDPAQVVEIEASPGKSTLKGAA